jgi:hypothetical protein
VESSERDVLERLGRARRGTHGTPFRSKVSPRRRTSPTVAVQLRATSGGKMF